MSNVPSQLKYSKTHEWVQKEDADTVRVGITDHAQHLLGDMVFVELPTIDRVVKKGDECAVVESVKAAADVYSPLSGKIIEINNQLIDAPEIVNSDPYGRGWLYVLQLSQPQELEELMDSVHYTKSIMNGS